MSARDVTLTLTVAAGAAALLVTDHLRTPYDQLFDSAALKHGIPGELPRAIARVESSFRPNARNDKNDPGEGADIGLMQINERTARALKRDVSLLNDPAYNLETACLLLVSLRRELGPKFSLMTWAAAYNAGAPAIRRRGVFNQAYASSVVWHALLYQIASGLRG
jgi:soluble lytic murein transglycosylase-like protein